MVIAPNSIAPTTKGGTVMGEYRWLNNLPIADAPDWLIDLCKEKESERAERVASEDLEIEVGKVIAALDASTNDDVDEYKWYQLISSAHASSGGALEVLDAFQRWSAKSPIKHNRDRNKSRWKALDRSPPRDIRAGTLYQHADETAPGWREAYEQASVDAMYATFAKSKTEGRS
jgi:hypothetical protein